MKIDWQRAAAYVVASDPEGRVLLTKFVVPGHPRSGAWTLPGGGMEWGEQPEQTAHRELLEETGLTAQIGPLLAVQAEWFDDATSERGQRGLALRLIYQGLGCAGTLKTDFSDDDTTAAAAWFTLAEIAQIDRVGVVDFGLSLVDLKPA